MARGGRARGIRALLTVPVLCLALLLVSGCTGDGETAAFQRAFADDSAIESMELTSHGNQPFTGGVSGDVFLRADVSDREFSDVVARVGDYTRENGDRMQGRVTLVAGGFEMLVTGDETLDDGAVRLLLTLRADARVTSVTVEESSVAVVGPGAGEAIELARDLPALLEDLAPNRRATPAVRSADGAVSLRGSERIPAAVRLWDALAADVPLAGLRARDDERIVVALQRESDLARAQEVAAEVPLDGGMLLAFASDLIRLGDSDGEDARLLLSRLDDDVRARIAYVWISDTRIQVAVRAKADLSAMVEPIGAALPPRITKATLVLESDPETDVAVRPANGP